MGTNRNWSLTAQLAYEAALILGGDGYRHFYEHASRIVRPLHGRKLSLVDVVRLSSVGLARPQGKLMKS